MTRRYHRWGSIVLVAAIWLPAAHLFAWPAEWIRALRGPLPAEEFSAAWGVKPEYSRSNFSQNGVLQVYLVNSSIPANILWPDDQAEFTFQFSNLTDHPVLAKGRARVVQYAVITEPPGDDPFAIGIRKIRDIGSVPLAVKVDAKGWQDIVVRPDIPARNGGYAVILELDGQDPLFGATCVRTFRPTNKSREFYQLCMDLPEAVALTRLGAAPNRVGFSYHPTTSADFETWYTNQTAPLRELQAAGLPVTVEIGGGDPQGVEQPLGQPRPWLNNDGVMLGGKADYAWLPAYDADFQKLVRRLLADYGWPKGPINAVKLWNEPWNGISISGWGADDERYREIYLAMAQAVKQAEKTDGVHVLVGGCDFDLEHLRQALRGRHRPVPPIL